MTVSASTANEVNATLIAPTSYEQYLALSTPADVAVTKAHTAIADGAKLFIFDRADNVYRTFTHTKTVHKIAFYDEDTLFFSDSSTKLYKLSLSALKNGSATAEKLIGQDGDVSCSTFTTHPGFVYYTTTSSGKTTLFSLSLEDGNSRELLSIENETPLAYGKDGLYYVREREGLFVLYATDPQLPISNSLEITAFETSIRSMAFASNLFCFITGDGDFYSYDYTTLKDNALASDAELTTHEKSDFVAVSSGEKAAYTIRKNAVFEYLIADAEFTDFEISASSASAGRLNDATDLLLAENRLFIADGGNDRISVYNTAQNVFETAITSTLPTPFMASYGNTLLVSSATEAILYDLSKKNYGQIELTISDDEIEGNVIGAASVYDRYYLLTDRNYCYMLSAESGDWMYTETQKKLHRSAMAFTADIYGSLYVAYNDDDVYHFTEKELTSSSENGTKILDGLTNAKKISVDYETNLYALSNGTLTKYTPNINGIYEKNTSYTPDYGLVNDKNAKVHSFAFGVDSTDVYLLYERDYIVKTDELQIPVVNPIPVGNAAQVIFGESNADFSVVTIAENTVLIEFDAALLQETTSFPYIAFERTQAEQIALKIGEEGAYSILSVAKERTGEFKTYLAETAACKQMEETLYRTRYENAKTGYLANDVSLYKFPYLTELLTVGEVLRGAELNIVGEVRKLDHAYFEIEFIDENGVTKKGYIPQSYVSLFDGSSPTPENVFFGKTENNTDAVWRCVYLILGLGAIGILVDFLILHKPKHED